MSYFRLVFSTVGLSFCCFAMPVVAQITPAANTTNTTVTMNGQNWNISGGSVSGDGNNLFHDFQDFNVGTNQSATFLSTPAIQNILSRVSGGNPSLIDGLLSVSGSNANLYLINPSGIVFGENAQLNLPADFTATTAIGVGFGDATWSDSTNYAELVGSPNQFFFDGTGGIINGADLAVGSGRSLNFFASQIINTGSLTADAGTINLTAVPGTNSLRLSQAGQLLNLEFNNGAPTTFVDIPRLLTGHDLETGVTVNNGVVELSATNTAISTNSGDLFFSGDLDVSGNLGGVATLLGKQIILTSSNLDASGMNGGGAIYIGGDLQGQGLFTNADNVFVDQNSEISAAAIASGDGGKVIIWSDQSTFFYGNINATGGQFGGDGGFVEVSGKQYLDFQGLVDLRSPRGQDGLLLLDPTDITISNNPTSQGMNFVAGAFGDMGNSPSNLSVMTLQNQLTMGDVVVTTASTGNMALGNITVVSPITWSSGNALELRADNDIIVRADITSRNQDSTLTLVAENDIRLEGTTQIGAFDNSTMSINLIADADSNGMGTVFQGSNVTLEGGFDFDESDFDGEFGDEEFGGEFGDDEFGGEFDDEFGDDEFGDDEFGDDEFDDDFGDDNFGDDEFDEDDEDFDEDDDFFGGDFDYEYEDDGWGDYDEELIALEDDFFDDYGDHFGLSEKPDTNFDTVQSQLATIQSLLDIEPAIIYVAFREKEGQDAGTKQSTKQTIGKDQNILWQFDENARQNYLDVDREARADDELELVMLTASGKVVRRRLVGSNRQAIIRAASSFHRSITSPNLGNTYLRSAQYFYDLLIKPLEAELNASQIDNLTFVMDRGLRTLPVAALHDGQEFVIEKYSVGMMPSFALTQTDYLDLRDSQVLAMGASEFQQQNDLPAVPVELSVIADRLWEGDVYLENQFTVDRLLAARDRQEYGIVHLATHGEFLPGSLESSYIQFWDQRVSLADLPKLQLNNPPIELLVLSACRTAFGDPNAELGFSGLAIASGAKSAIGSLWYVSDEGTLGLMTQFYQELQSAPIKAEALRQAQLALLNGEVRREGTNLITPEGTIPLPDAMARLRATDLTHPYVWSSFSLVGNPW